MTPQALPELMPIPGGVTAIGSSQEEIETAVGFWGGRLVLPGDSPRHLRHTLLREHPAHEVEVAPYHLGRTPITQREYAAFVLDTRFPVPLSGLGRPQVPVWGVDVHAALVYCSWLSDRLRRRVRLPTEVEWEWAARGPERRPFPWGDRFDPGAANTAESGPGTPTPVSAYPGGRSWCGLDDLAGNVEEWVATTAAPYPGGWRVVEDTLARVHPDGFVVLRGGSCALGGDAARSARRHGGPLAGERFQYTGFRVATE